jgi:DNA-binding transcriptional MerR regulator
MPTRLTVDELAFASGLPTSTLRLYRQRGLLHAPAMEGRVGYYDDSHVTRLRLIGELRARGFSLASIKDLVDNWESGRDLDAELGVERALVRDGQARETLTNADLEARLPDLAAAPHLRSRLIELDIVRTADDGTITVPSGFLQMAAALSGLGIPLQVMLDEYAPVWTFAVDTARRFVQVFESHVLADASAIDPAAVGPMIAAFRTAAREVVGAALDRAIDEEAAAAVVRFADGTRKGPKPKLTRTSAKDGAHP